MVEIDMVHGKVVEKYATHNSDLKDKDGFAANLELVGCGIFEYNATTHEMMTTPVNLQSKPWSL